MTLSPSRTRFAPSPTGSLHIGGVRTALYCLLWARRTGGRFILRIEDTDRARSTEESANGLQRDLKWLGLDWDEGPEIGGVGAPHFQSKRLDKYNDVIEQLLASGHAYHAWETPEELGEARKQAERAKENYRYTRRHYSDEDLARFASEGRTPVVRLAAPTEAVTVEDAVLGAVTVAADELEDIVIRKADGYPTYHLAVVVDDQDMQVDLILRGQEHLRNTHKHHGITQALGWPNTECGHLPIIFNPTGSKMSKRDKAKAARAGAREARPPGVKDWQWLADGLDMSVDDLDRFMNKKSSEVSIAEAIAAHLNVELPMIEVMDFRRAGYVPEALLNYLALLGWSPGDDRQILSMDEMIEAFHIERITKTPARFDGDKLRWLNGEYLRGLLTDEVLLERLDEWLAVVESPIASLSADKRLALFELYRPRVHTFAEWDEAARFFFTAPTAYDAKSVKKHLLKGGGLQRLPLIRQVLTDVGRWEGPSLERALTQMCEDVGVGLGKVAQPLRIALSGSAVTPGIYEVLEYLGRDETIDRLTACIDHHEAE